MGYLSRFKAIFKPILACSRRIYCLSSYFIDSKNYLNLTYSKFDKLSLGFYSYTKFRINLLEEIMLKRIFIVIFSITSCVAWSASTDFVRTPIDSGHPYIGRWIGQMPELKCFEDHDIRADGTRSVIAGEERAESEFSISALPNSNGYYVLKDKVVKSNGKPDCSGSITKVGSFASVFIKMHSSRDKYLLCFEEKMESCVAEYNRQK